MHEANQQRQSAVYGVCAQSAPKTLSHHGMGLMRPLLPSYEVQRSVDRDVMTELLQSLILRSFRLSASSLYLLMFFYSIAHFPTLSPIREDITKYHCHG